MRAFLKMAFAAMLAVKSVAVGAGVQVFDRHPFPAKLSGWQIFVISGNQLNLNEGVLPYDLVNPLFSDYAVKFRTVWVPEGRKILYQQKDSFIFPQGSILTKTFAYPKNRISFPGGPARQNGPLPAGNASPLKDLTLVETRILVKTSQGWVGLPYVWDADQQDATLSLIGELIPVRVDLEETGEKSFRYQVPNFNQCKGCHVRHIEFSKPVLPVGPKARNLNRTYPYAHGLRNQISYWQQKGILEGVPPEGSVPFVARWDDPEATPEARARGYLDINCAHCHSPLGPANTSGLFLDVHTVDPAAFGVCKSPVAVGNAGGGRIFDIVPGRPDLSILYYRMESTDPSVMMPEVGRNLAHSGGLAVIYEWIAGMEGSCEVVVP